MPIGDPSFVSGWARSPCQAVDSEVMCTGLCIRYTDQSGEEEEDYESEEQLQHRILTAALEFVPAHGWTAEAIAEGAQVGRGEGGAAGPGEPRVRTTDVLLSSCLAHSFTGTGLSGLSFTFFPPIG